MASGNNEFDRAITLAVSEGRRPSVRALALRIGIPYTTLIDQYRRGFMSNEAAVAARRAFPALDLEALITPPGFSEPKPAA